MLEAHMTYARTPSSQALGDMHELGCMHMNELIGRLCAGRKDKRRLGRPAASAIRNGGVGHAFLRQR
jgi:hypothetical protein